MSRPKRPVNLTSAKLQQLFDLAIESDLTYEEIAHRAGYSLSAIDDWKRGKVSPKLNSFEDVLSVLGYKIIIVPENEPDA